MLKENNVKFVYSSSGCKDAITQSKWNKFTEGMCNHCNLKMLKSQVVTRLMKFGEFFLNDNIDLIYREMLPNIVSLKPLTRFQSRSFITENPKIFKIPKKYLIHNPQKKTIVTHFLANHHLRLKGKFDPKGSRVIIKEISNLQKLIKILFLNLLLTLKETLSNFILNNQI